MLRKAKFDYYQNINLSNFTDNRKFWKTVKPIFSDKVQVNKDSEIAEIFYHHFATITNSLGISIHDSVLLPTNGMLDSVDKAVRKYDAHPSICKIRENVKITNKFELSEVSTSDIAVQIKQLNSKKASPVDSIPARIHKENSDVFTVVIQFLFNSHMSKCIFPEELKAADITSLFKQEDAFSKKNYRPITVLPSASKIFERLMQNQMQLFAQSFLSPLLCGFREGYGTQHALLYLIEAGNKSIESGGISRGCFDRPLEGLRLSRSRITNRKIECVWIRLAVRA